ncbi:Toll/interleukin-1 receptor domain-containing protein [Tanacetum coccineum]
MAVEDTPPPPSPPPSTTDKIIHFSIPNNLSWVLYPYKWYQEPRFEKKESYNLEEAITRRNKDFVPSDACSDVRVRLRLNPNDKERNVRVSVLLKPIKAVVFVPPSSLGEDTRNNFVGHEYHALQQKGIETYKDEEKIEKGKTVNGRLIKSIEDSRFYIIVSPRTMLLHIDMKRKRLLGRDLKATANGSEIKIGGVEKTTLARAVFDQISIHFEGKSFVENVKEVSKASLLGLKKLQKQIVSNVLNKQDITIEEVVQYADGLPLTIKVLGSFLCGQNEPQWIDALQRLKAVPLKAAMEILELSYDGWDEEDTIRALESRGFHARNGLRVLEQKSLITISYHGYLGMHDHIEEMGRDIIHRLHRDEPNRHSRLWNCKEIEDIVVNEWGTQATKCITLRTEEYNADILMKGQHEGS